MNKQFAVVMIPQCGERDEMVVEAVEGVTNYPPENLFSTWAAAAAAADCWNAGGKFQPESA